MLSSVCKHKNLCCGSSSSFSTSRTPCCGVQNILRRSDVGERWKGQVFAVKATYLCILARYVIRLCQGINIQRIFHQKYMCYDNVISHWYLNNVIYQQSVRVTHGGIMNSITHEHSLSAFCLHKNRSHKRLLSNKNTYEISSPKTHKIYHDTPLCNL